MFFFAASLLSSPRFSTQPEALMFYPDLRFRPDLDFLVLYFLLVLCSCYFNVFSNGGPFVYIHDDTP